MRARQRVAKQISAHASYTVMKRAVVAVEPGCPAHSQLPGSADVFALLYLGNVPYTIFLPAILVVCRGAPRCDCSAFAKVRGSP
jgi:hypothetical protein